HGAIDAVAFIDDNKALRGLTISGLPVHGPRDLKALIEQKRVDRVLLAMPGLPRHRLQVLALKLQDYGVGVHAVPAFAQLAGEEELLRRIEPVSIEGLIGRAQVEDDLPGAEETFAGRTVMVT